MESPITPHNPPLNTSVRKTVALLAKAAAADCESALLDWARDRGFAINRTDSRILLELGANRQRKVQHAITLRSQSEITVILLESKAKGHAPSPELDNLLEATDALAHLKPEYIRNQLPAIQDGLAFQRDILRLLRQTEGGLPFILIAPPHAGRSPAFDKVLRESADIDLICVGNRTARRLRKAKLEEFTRGTLLLRRPGHATQLMPCGNNGEGVADAVKMARDSLAASFRTLRPAQGEGDPVPNRHSRFATVRDAVGDAAERTGDILWFHDNALESAGDSLYHDPDWVNAALLAAAILSLGYAQVRVALEKFRARQTKAVLAAGRLPS
jgi:hypothetical protein